MAVYPGSGVADLDLGRRPALPGLEDDLSGPRVLGRVLGHVRDRPMKEIAVGERPGLLRRADRDLDAAGGVEARRDLLQQRSHRHDRQPRLLDAGLEPGEYEQRPREPREPLAVHANVLEEAVARLRNVLGAAF